MIAVAGLGRHLLRSISIIVGVALIALAAATVEAESTCPGAAGGHSGNIRSMTFTKGGANLTFSNNPSYQYDFEWNAYDSQGTLVYQGSTGWQPSGTVGGNVIANVPGSISFSSMDVVMYDDINNQTAAVGSGSDGCGIADVDTPKQFKLLVAINLMASWSQQTPT